MSPTRQNELIDIVAKYMIHKWLIEDIKEVKYDSISADEVTSVYVYEHICIMCMCVYTYHICVYVLVYIYIYICRIDKKNYIYIHGRIDKKNFRRIFVDSL